MSFYRLKSNAKINLSLNVLGKKKNTLHRIETLVRAAMQAARYVNAKFRGRIEETLRGASHAAPGVDLSMETRVEKARTCYRLMMELRVLVSQYVARTDDVGEEARVLARDLPSSS